MCSMREVTMLGDDRELPEHPESKNAGTVRRPQWRVLVVRTVSTGAVLLMLWQVLASFLWIFPPSPLRQLVPGNALTSYMIPMFGQSWSVFAPEPINGDYHFNVRAVVKTDDGEETTGWVSATDVELSMVKYNLFPPRAGVQAEELASTVKGAWDALNDDHREVARLGYFEGKWEQRLAEKLRSYGDREAQVEDYTSEEHRAVAYATQVAKALWGERVVRVQYRVSRQNVVPFAERNSPDAVRPEPQTVLPGWRAPLVEAGQDEKNFADIFASQYKRLQGER